MEKLALTVEEMTEALQVSRSVGYQLIHREGFPAVRISERKYLIPVDALKRYLNEQAGMVQQ